VALARARPGSVSFAHIGLGTSQHIGGEMLAQMSGTELNAIAYNDPATQVPDVLTGRVTMCFNSVVVTLPRIRDGAWRALAVSSATRSPAAPEIPTVAEQGFEGFNAVAWLALLAPVSMPAAKVARVHRDAIAALADPELRARLADLGIETVGSTLAEFRALMEREIPRMAGVLTRAGIRLE